MHCNRLARFSVDPSFTQESQAVQMPLASYFVHEALWKRRPSEIKTLIEKKFEDANRDKKYPVLDQGAYSFGSADAAFTSAQFLEQIRRNSTTPRILDVGAGEGNFVKNANYSVEAYGLSAHDYRVDKKTANYFVGNAETLVENKEKLGENFPHAFSGIISSYTIMHLVDPLGTISQLYQLLEPNGVLLVDSFYCYGLNGYLPELIAFLNSQGYRIWAGTSSAPIDNKQNGRFHYLKIEKTHVEELNFPVQYDLCETGLKYKIDHSFIPLKKGLPITEPPASFASSGKAIRQRNIEIDNFEALQIGPPSEGIQPF